MNLSVVIPTHNRHQDISHLLESLLLQDLSNLVIEVLVIGNLKDDQLEKIVSTFSIRAPFTLSYYYVGKVGVNSARNLGIEKAHASKIYFLDDDILIGNPAHLKTLYQLSVERPGVAAIGGSYYLSPEVKIIDEVYHAICTSWLQEGQHNEQNMVHLVGGNTLYNREILKDRLQFNEQIKFGGSETELNLRLHLAGDEFFFSNALDVEHSTHLSSWSLMKKAIRQGMGKSFHEVIVPETFWKTDKNNPKIFLRKLSDNKFSYAMAQNYVSLYEFFFHVGYRHGKRQDNGPLSLWAVLVCMFQTFFQINSDQVLNFADSDAEAFHQKKFPALKFRELYHWMKANVWWKIPYYLFTKIPGLTWSLIVYVYWRIFYVLSQIFWITRHLVWLLGHFLLYKVLKKISHFFCFIIPQFFIFLRWKISHYFMLSFNFAIWKIVPLAGSIVISGVTTFFPFNTIGLRVPYNNAFNTVERLLKRRN